jgi:NAD(P)-dependent dehydrogenase (short-subunit alcohol dehydrogenase family)
MPDLTGKVAVVTGASRGVGRGVALALAEAGAIVYATGRTVSGETFADAWRIIGVPCDHTDDRQVESLFGRVADEVGRLDVLVNSAWGGYERMVEDGRFTWPVPFWEQPAWRWDAMFQAGVRAAYVASCHAARVMVAQRSGLIANVSFWAAQKYVGNVPYGVSKAATDKLSADAAHELRGYGVACVSLYPGLVRTEKVLEAADFLDLSNSESPPFVGRAVAALAADPEVLGKSGRALVAAELAREYGFTDVDGRQPRPLTLEDV